MENKTLSKKVSNIEELKKRNLERLQSLDLNNETVKEIFGNKHFIFEDGKVLKQCKNPYVYVPGGLAIVLSSISWIIPLCFWRLEAKNAPLLFFINLIIFIFINIINFSIKSYTVIDYRNQKIYKRNQLFSSVFTNGTISFNDIESVETKHHKYYRHRKDEFGRDKSREIHESKVIFNLNDGSTYEYIEYSEGNIKVNNYMTEVISIALKKPYKLFDEKAPINYFETDNNGKLLSDEFIDCFKNYQAILIIILLFSALYLFMFFLLK